MSFICITPICWSSTRLFTRIAFNEEGPLRVRLDVHRRQFRAGNNLPLTIENCGYQETFTRPPERVVALGQNTVEILLLLGLQKQVVASAFWPTSVLPQLAEQNAKIKTLTVEIPSLESVLAQNPDFVPAQLPLLLGPESKVARREDLATVGVNSYVSPGMCATKKATGDMYGSRQKLWDMTWLYQEISDFARIFNVEDRGQALIADFKNVKPTCARSLVKAKGSLLRLLVLQRLTFGRCLCRRQKQRLRIYRQRAGRT